MLQEVDQSIKNLLFAELRTNSDGLVHDEDQIVFGLPADDEAKASDTPKIHLFLHDVHENLALRDQSFDIKRGSDEWEVGKARKPVKLNLSYLLTVRGKDPATEHRILGDALGVLLRNGFVPPKDIWSDRSCRSEKKPSCSPSRRRTTGPTATARRFGRPPAIPFVPSSAS